MVDRAAVFADGPHCTSIQFRLNAIFDDPEMRQLCSEHNLAGINKDPLNKGILTGKYSTKSRFPDDDIRSRADFEDERLTQRFKTIDALRDVLCSGGRTMAQGAIGYIWALDDHMIPIPGFKSVEQVEDNAGAMDFGTLSSEQVRQIQAIVTE